MNEASIDIRKYSNIVSEIEKFVEAKKKKITTVKGIVDKIDISNNILTVKLNSSEQPDLSRGSLVLIREDDPLSVDIRATINDVYNSTLKIEIKRDPLQFENKKVIIDKNKTNVILDRLKNIVENINKGKISLDNQRILNFLIGENKSPQYSSKRISFTSKKLNENQREAITKSMEANDFHLIIGPPGTGKTYVIEELIRQFSKMNQKLLITAWTNLAVDNIIKRLMRSESKNIVRIGPLNEIDPEIRKYSIFEKMKKHKDWKDVERQNKIIDKLFKIIPEVKEDIEKVQKIIDKTKEEVMILNKEADNLNNEKQNYQEKVSIPMEQEHIPSVLSINGEIDVLSQKSDSCLVLSKNILQMNRIEAKIPDSEYVRQLKKNIRNVELSLLGKRLSSIFSNQNNKEIEELKQDYEKNQKYLEEIAELQRNCNLLKKQCEKDLTLIYSDKKGHPDKDALNFEFKIYKMLEDKYLPVFREKEMAEANMRAQRMDREVYMLYLESLKAKIDLLNIKIKGLNTELYIEINKRNSLHGLYLNLLSSLDYHRKSVDKLIRAIVSEIIDDADLIATTAVSSCHYFLDDVTFDAMIMDEASQVASFMSLLPLLKCKKFVLVGDNKQLQPIEEENISKEMNLSIFNRLFEMYPVSSSMLTIQYRMHDTIAQIANEIFYEGKLRTSEEVAEKILSLKPRKHQFLNPKMPVMFIDTSKIGYYEEEVGSGCSNSEEAKYVAYIVSLFIKNGVKAVDIGIITPYVKQKLLIKECLKDIEINDVEVDTVHKFQGREKDVIIMSFARSKKYSFSNYKLRFIENETLVNVAITRAKKKLILIGNLDTLRQSRLLDRVVKKIGIANKITL